MMNNGFAITAFCALLLFVAVAPTEEQIQPRLPASQWGSYGKQRSNNPFEMLQSFNALPSFLRFLPFDLRQFQSCPRAIQLLLHSAIDHCKNGIGSGDGDFDMDLAVFSQETTVQLIFTDAVSIFEMGLEGLFCALESAKEKYLSYVNWERCASESNKLGSGSLSDIDIFQFVTCMNNGVVEFCKTGSPRIPDVFR